MKSQEWQRRRFLKEGVALAGLAAGAFRSARGQSAGPETPEAKPPEARSKERRAYSVRERGVRSRFETTVRRAKSGAAGGVHTPLHDLMGGITPSGLFFQIGTDPPPDIDPAQHRLLIHGMVDRPLIFTVAELQRLPSVSRLHFIECGGNGGPTNQPNIRLGNLMKNKDLDLLNTHGSVGCAEWTGVLLSVLLREAGVQQGARWILAEGADADKHARSIPMEKAMDDVLVAYGQNGEMIRPEQGYPLKLLVAGWEGNMNVKWLRRIKVVDKPYMTKMETTAYPSLRPDGKARWFQFQMGPKSVISFPCIGKRLPGRGFYEIKGWAWSGGGAIRRVEVSTDGGRTWKDAELQEPVHRIAFTLFRFPWTWNGEEAVIQSRCTDDRGNVQPSLAEYGQIYGVPSMEYWWTATNPTQHFNAIQPWRVAADGSVHNALLS